MLPLSALLLLGGAAGDHFGRRRMLVAGIAIFALASILCTIAPDLDILLAARGLQGIGGAMLMPNSLAILGNAFEGEARTRDRHVGRGGCNCSGDRAATWRLACRHGWPRELRQTAW